MPALVTTSAILTPVVLLLTAVLNFLSAYRKEAESPSANPRGMRAHARRLQAWQDRRANTRANARANARTRAHGAPRRERVRP